MSRSATTDSREHRVLLSDRLADTARCTFRLRGAFGGQRDGVTFGIGHVGNALAPEHVFGLSQDWGAGGLEFFDALVDIVDVDEQLEARTLADLEADELSG